MKSTFLITLVIVLFAACNVTDKDDALPITAEMIAPENPPVMNFKSMTHDFGNVAFGEKLSHTFEFMNEGDTPLIIHSVKPSCHCTILQDWPKDPVKPGEVGKITAQFEGKFEGTNRKTISIVANTKPNVTRLELKAEVIGG